MKINWNIEKKRGNFRPALSYTITLEDFEQELGVAMVNIESTIPKIDDSHLDHCFPDCYERQDNWQPKDFHWLNTPYFKDGQTCKFIRLPFREDGKYPEVEQSFNQLREQHEKLVREAYSKKPIKKEVELDFTQKTKEAIAGALAAKKMLAFFSD